MDIWGTRGIGDMGNGAQGAMGTGGIGHMGNGNTWAIGYRDMGYRGYWLHGQWGHMGQ